MSSKKVLALFLVLALGVVVLALPGCAQKQEAKPEDGKPVDEKIALRFAGTEPEGDFTSVFAEAFCKAVHEWSDGDIDIQFYPYGALGEITDVIESTSMGVTDMVTVDYGWASTLIPELQVTALHYLFPSERIGELLEWILVNGETFEVMEDIFREKGLVPLGWSMMGWQYMTSNRPIEKLADMQGIKFRLMDSALLFDMYRNYGTAPTATPFSEVYGGLQMGMIEAQANPLHSIRSMGFYEVQDYITQIWAEPFIVVPAINAKVYDSLPEDAQRFIKDWYKENSLRFTEWGFENNDKKKQEILEARPDIVIDYLDEEAIAEFREAVAPSHERFKKDLGGPRATEIYEVLKSDIEKAKEALGIE